MRRARGQLKGPLRVRPPRRARGVRPSGRRRPRGARRRPRPRPQLRRRRRPGRAGPGSGRLPARHRSHLRHGAARRPRRRRPPRERRQHPRGADAGQSGACRRVERPARRPRRPSRRPSRRWRGCRCCRRTGAGGCSRSAAAPVSGSAPRSRRRRPAGRRRSGSCSRPRTAPSASSCLVFRRCPGWPSRHSRVGRNPDLALVVSSATWRSSKPRTCGRPT